MRGGRWRRAAQGMGAAGEQQLAAAVMQHLPHWVKFNGVDLLALEVGEQDHARVGAQSGEDVRAERGRGALPAGSGSIGVLAIFPLQDPPARGFWIREQLRNIPHK